MKDTFRQRKFWEKCEKKNNDGGAGLERNKRENTSIMKEGEGGEINERHSNDGVSGELI